MNNNNATSLAASLLNAEQTAAYNASVTALMAYEKACEHGADLSVRLTLGAAKRAAHKAARALGV
jgi:hypothetical protein